MFNMVFFSLFYSYFFYSLLFLFLFFCLFFSVSLLFCLPVFVIHLVAGIIHVIEDYVFDFYLRAFYVSLLLFLSFRLVTVSVGL